MNFLSAVLPGLRHVRTPFVVGVLWLSLAYAVAADEWATWISGNDGLRALDAAGRQIPNAWGIGALGFAIYLLGSVTAEVGDFLWRWPSRWIGQASQKAADWANPRAYSVRRGLLVRTWIWHWAHRLRDALHPLTPTIRTPILDAVAAMYASIGARSGAHFSFPTEAVYARLESTALQLSQSAPEQYQEFDRLRSEAELRSGIIPPLLVWTVLLSTTIVWWLAVPFIVALGVLGWQAHRARRSARLLVATAIYHGTTLDPLMSAMNRQLSELPRSREPTSGEWTALTVVALERLGEYDAAERAFWDSFDGEWPSEDQDEDTQALFEYLRRQGSQMPEMYKRRRESELARAAAETKPAS
jgi:hypothetical protein